MAKLVKAADRHTLSHDTGTLADRATNYLLPYVSYDQELLANTFVAYGDNASLATALSGTSDKKSKPYKAAIRSVQIWKKGQAKPSKAYQAKLINALAAKKLPAINIKDAIGNVKNGASISITGYVQISDTPAEYRTLHADMDSYDLQQFLHAAVSGDTDTALSIFADQGSYPTFDLYSSADNPIVVQFS